MREDFGRSRPDISNIYLVSFYLFSLKVKKKREKFYLNKFMFLAQPKLWSLMFYLFTLFS